MPIVMQQACVFAGWSIFQKPCVFFPEIPSTALLGVGYICGFYPLKFPTMTGMVGKCSFLLLDGVLPLYNCSKISI